MVTHKYNVTCLSCRTCAIVAAAAAVGEDPSTATLASLHSCSHTHLTLTSHSLTDTDTPPSSTSDSVANQLVNFLMGVTKSVSFKIFQSTLLRFSRERESVSKWGRRRWGGAYILSPALFFLSQTKLFSLSHSPRPLQLKGIQVTVNYWWGPPSHCRVQGLRFQPRMWLYVWQKERNVTQGKSVLSQFQKINL